MTMLTSFTLPAAASGAEVTPAADDNAIRPFHVSIPQAALDDLRRRVLATQWPEKETVTDTSQGVPLAAMQEHLLEPYQSLSCTPSATYGADEQEFVNWDPYVNHSMTLPEALPPALHRDMRNLGLETLTLSDPPAEVEAETRRWAEEFAARQVRSIREQIFPIHGL